MTKRELLSKISKAADTISRSSIRGSANYVVTSKETYEEFHRILRRHKRVEKIKRLSK
jgi:hypothetical protein